MEPGRLGRDVTGEGAHAPTILPTTRRRYCRVRTTLWQSVDTRAVDAVEGVR
jgi:hypothetical protein